MRRIFARGGGDSPGRGAARSGPSREGCFVSSRRAIARGVAWVASAVVTIAAAQPADAQSKLEARYTASLAGVPLGRGMWVIDVAGDHYSSSASGKTVGLLVFSGGEGSVAASGTVNGGEPVSAHYAATVVTEKRSDKVEIALASGTVKEYSAVPVWPASRCRAVGLRCRPFP